MDHQRLLPRDTDQASQALLEQTYPRASQDITLQDDEEVDRYREGARLSGSNGVSRLRSKRNPVPRLALAFFLLFLLVLNTSLWTVTTQLGAPVAGKDACAGPPPENSAQGQRPEQEPETFHGFEIQSDDYGRFVQCPKASSDAARAHAGCSFDVLLYGWLPGPCFDEEMYQHHAKPGAGLDFGFFADADGTERIATADLAEGNYERYPEAFVSNDGHWQHCNYLLNTSVRFRWKEPAVFLNMHLHQEHMSHCLEYVTNPDSSRSLDVNSTLPKADFTAKRRCYIEKK